ncbi:hypothetical protein T09_15766, partial [Trichinella sp. T9]
LRSRLLDSISSAFSTSSALAASAKCPRSSLRCYSAPSVLTAAIYGKVVAAGRHRRGTIKTWDMNGTFKLLFIHAIVVSKLVPVVCCYVRYYTLKHTNRNEKCWICAAGIRGCRGKLYTNLVATQYSDITPGNKAAVLEVDLNPDTIICDFETALIPAIRGYFPNTRVQGCYFHFCQAVHRKVGELGLKTRYRTEEPTKRKIRMLLATAFLPVPHVNTGVSLLEAGTTGNLSALFQYFRQEGMIDERLPLWNVYNVNIRTNNHLEGWYNRLNRKAGKSHNGLYELLQLLIDTLFSKYYQETLPLVNKVYAQKQRQVARVYGNADHEKV